MRATESALAAAGLLVLALTAGPGWAQAPAANLPGALVARQEVRAQLRAVRFTTLSAEIGGVLKQLPLAEGERFAANAPLALLDCGLHEAQRAKSAAELAGAERSLQANERLAQLNASGLMELDLARNAVDKARAELQMSDAQLSKCQILAPFDGVVAEHRVREQQYVQPGTPVLDILDDSSYELEFLVPSTWISRLRPGMSIRMRIDETGRDVYARVLRTSPRIDPVSQTLRVTAAVQGAARELRPGMSGRLLMP